MKASGPESSNPPPVTPEAADPGWFREPTAREHALAAALFIAFGLFFVVLFFVLLGWWFRWVVGGLGVLSVLHGLWHAVESRPGEGSGFRVQGSGEEEEEPGGEGTTADAQLPTFDAQRSTSKVRGTARREPTPPGSPLNPEP